MRNKIIVLIVGLGVLLAGCAVGPSYRAPVVTSAPKFAGATTNIMVATQPEVRWWGLFNDDPLNDLIRRAAESNHDLRIAQARLNEARALRRGTLWAFAPQGGVGGGFERRQFSSHETASLEFHRVLGIRGRRGSMRVGKSTCLGVSVAELRLPSQKSVP